MRNVLRIVAALTCVVNCFVAAGKPTLYLGSKPFPKLIEATTEDLITGMERGVFTSADLVKAYSARIMELNSTLNVVTELNPDAMSIAAQLDQERQSGKVRGPLHGVPILIKNNIGTNDKMNNTAGSFSLLGTKLPRDSFIASQLRKAGAVILGKTNLSQWANFRSDNTSNGWSAYGGQVYGAYYPKQDPSGSSSGSGVASSLGLALAALGTETSGSILSPSDVNNLCSVKPTVGLTSRDLVIPISEHQDTVGPMARYCRDAAYLLQAIVGKDQNDNYTSAIPEIPDYVAALNYSSLRGARLGVARNVISLLSDNTTTPPVVAAFEKALDVIRQAGATVVDTNFPQFEQFLNDGNSTVVLNGDFLTDLNHYLTSLASNPNGYTNLEQIRNFTQTFGPEDYPDRDTGVWDAALQQGFNNSDPRFWAAYQINLQFGDEGGVLGALKRDNLDAILLPTQFSPYSPAVVGSPVVTVPMGFYNSSQPVALSQPRQDLVATGPNIPFGLSFMGDKFTEAKLLGYAYAYEQRTFARDMVQPYIQSNIELADVMAN